MVNGQAKPLGWIWMVVGPEKTGKTTFAQSAPKPMAYLELDAGGFARAAWRLTPEDRAGITLHTFTMPQQVDSNSMTELKETIRLKSQNRTVLRKEGRTLIGMTELWYEFLTEYVVQLENPEIQTIVMDSFSSVWEMCHKSHLQTIQESGSGRTSLNTFEYADPNSRMTALLQAARDAGKNLVLIHHTADSYGSILDADGRMSQGVVGTTHKGWSHVKPLVDMETWFELIDIDGQKRPSCEVTLTGLTLDIHGMKFPEPTWTYLQQVIQTMRGEAVVTTPS